MSSHHSPLDPNAQSRVPMNGDEQSVRQVVVAYQEAWNKHDADVMAALFTDGIEWINIVGMWWRGLPNVKLAHRRIHETIFKNTPFQIDSCSVRFLTPEIAIAVVTLSIGGVVTPDGEQRPPGKDRLSLVMLRRDREWKISHGHNTPIDQKAQPFDPVNRG
jgi:uncharacterized protein (TIGR02246 family)